MSHQKFITQYLKRLTRIIAEVDTESIIQIMELIESVASGGHRIYFIGNGGSAATASHMANDFGSGLRRRELLNLDVVSLADNSSIVTALANDIGFENIFYMQLKDVITKEDVVFAISCSGNSPNIIKAVEYAVGIGSKVVGITGFKGGKLKQLSDINFHVPTESGEYGICEDMHMILDHIIYSYYTRNEV